MHARKTFAAIQTFKFDIHTATTMAHVQPSWRCRQGVQAFVGLDGVHSRSSISGKRAVMARARNEVSLPSTESCSVPCGTARCLCVGFALGHCRGLRSPGVTPLPHAPLPRPLQTIKPHIHRHRRGCCRNLHRGAVDAEPAHSAGPGHRESQGCLSSCPGKATVLEHLVYWVYVMLRARTHNSASQNSNAGLPLFAKEGLHHCPGPHPPDRPRRAGDRLSGGWGAREVRFEC